MASHRFFLCFSLLLLVSEVLFFGYSRTRQEVRRRIDAAERGCIGKTRSLTPYFLAGGGEKGNQLGEQGVIAT